MTVPVPSELRLRCTIWHATTGPTALLRLIDVAKYEALRARRCPICWRNDRERLFGEASAAQP